MTKLSILLVDAACGLLAKLPTALLLSLARSIINQHARMLAADKSLRFLFELDSFLYALQGREAKRLGGGSHPKHELTNYHDFFATRIHKGDAVLEIGCGTGELAQDIVSKTGCSLTAIEISAEKVEEARRRHSLAGLEFVAADALQFTPDKEISVVVLSNVLEHIAPRIELLRRMASLEPRLVLLRVPLFERDWRVPLRQRLGATWKLDPTHETEYTLESFKDEMKQADLAIDHLEVRWGEIWAQARPVKSTKLKG